MAQRELRLQSEWLKVTLANIGDAVIFTDRFSCITFMNRMAEQNTGWSERDACGKSLSEVCRTLDEVSRQMRENPVLKVIEEGITDVLRSNTILLAKNNTEIFVEENISPITLDGNEVVGTAVIFRDISTRYRLEQQVRLHHDSEHFIASIVESSNDAIVSKSLKGIIQTWNIGAQRLFGYSAEQAIGSHISLIIPEERVQDEEHILKRICDGERVEHYETVRRRKDGELVQVSITVSPIRDEKGEIIGASKIARDISEKLRTELELQQSEERYRALAEASATVVWRTSPNGEVLFASDDWSRITGQSEEEKTGWGWLNAIHPDDRHRTIQLWKESIANQTLHENEFRVRTREGFYRWFVVRSVPVINTDGSVREWVGANTDIHDRRTAEEDLTASSLRFQTLADNIAQFAWMADETGAIYWYNQRWYDFTGTTLNEMKGWGWKKVHHPDYVDEVVTSFQHCLESGQQWEDTFPIRGKDGQYRWFLSHALPIREDGKIVSWFGTNTDITQQREAEKSLRESEQRMRLATEATGVGIWEWNILTGEVRWDSQMFRIYGITVPESRSVAYSDWSNAVVPEDLKRQEEALQNTIKTVGSGCREFRIRRKIDQKLRHVQSFETVRTNADGKPEWIVGTNLDITDRKIAEDALRRLAADLSDMDRRKDEFLATLAHELRNPLAPIRSGLQLLQFSDINCEEAKETRGIMERQLAQLVRLVDDLMDVSRIVTGKIELQRKPILLSEVLNSAIEANRSLIDQMNHRLTIRLPEAPIRLDADFTRLAQIFLNLVNNAAKYCEPNGSIAIDVQLSGNDAVISIRDTGIGISIEQLPLIFEMFTQVDRSLEKSRGGLGIGLSLVRRLLDMHGGSIVATSAGVGMGSEFVVRIPTLSRQAMAAIELPSEKELATNRSLRILIVDDNRDSVTTISMLLRRLGHQTYKAFDGEAALEAAREFKPQVVLLDIGLPKLNGYEVCRWIRAQKQPDKVVVIAQTGWGQEETRQKTTDAGFDYHMVKPLDPNALRNILAKVTT